MAKINFPNIAQENCENVVPFGVQFPSSQELGCPDVTPFNAQFPSNNQGVTCYPACPHTHFYGDITGLTYQTILGRYSSGTGIAQLITLGAGLSLSAGGILSSASAGGTVTSVAASITGNSLGITGSPIITNGTLAFAFAGTNLQYINGAGDLTTFPSLTGYVPYTGATAGVDLGAFKLNAQSLHAKGTAGNGYLGLKHQSASATASANEVSLFADSLGDLSWQNGNLYLSKFITSSNTVARSYTFPDATGTVALLTSLSSSATGLTYTNTTGVFSFTVGYSLPTNTSQTNWDTAYTNRITSANSPLSITANAISIAQATTSTSGYLSSTDWNTFNGKGSGVVTSITGTASRITIAGTAAIPTVDISTSYVGQATITTLGTIGTGTWNGTVIAGQYGGTGVANTGKTITLAGNLTTTGAFNTSFTQQISGTYTLPPVATATLAASAAVLTSGRIPYVTTSGMLLDSANFLWDNTNMRLNVGNGATVPNSTTTGAWFSNNTTSAIVGLWLGQTSTNYGALFRYGSSYASNIFSGNTSLTSTDALLLYNNQGSAKAIYISTNNGIIVNVANISGAATVASTRLDDVGFKVSALSNANSAATSMLQTTGSFAAGIALKSGSYTLAITDFTVVFDGTSLTATLPAASTCTGRIYVLVNRNATALTTSVAYNTLTTGVTSTTVTAASSVWIQSDGTNYYQIK